MKKFLLLIFIISLFARSAVSQESDIKTISGSFSNISFNEFSQRLFDEYNISVFFKSEWVSDININAEGDSLSVKDILAEHLTPVGINYYTGPNGNIYLTGSKIIIDNGGENITGDNTLTQQKAVTSNLFGNFSYERAVNRVVVGEKEDAIEGSILTISGKIISASSGEPVIGATVIIEDINHGVISDGDGNYTIQLSAASTYNLTISCLGMESETYIAEFNSSGILNIEMEEKLIDIMEVVVKSGKHDNVRGIQMGFQKIDIKEIKTMPVVMGERDILKVAKMMPGVQSVGEGSSGFYVRGSSSDQNLFMINEIPVLNTGHLFGFFSAFNPDMIHDFNLYKSNFPVEFGGRLASVFEVSTRKGNKKTFGARGGISPITGSLLVETPLVEDRVSVIMGARSTYSDWILNRIDDPDIQNSNASFYDLMVGVHTVIDEKSSAQLFGYYSNDRFTLAGTNYFRYENKGASMIYDRQINNNWSMDVAAVFSRYVNYQSDISRPALGFEHEFNVDHSELKVKFRGFQFMDHVLTFGGNFVLHNIDQGDYSPYGAESILSIRDFGVENALEYAFFASDEYSITDKLTIYGGLRYSLYNYLGPKEIYSYAENLPRELRNITDTTIYKQNRSVVNYSGPEYRLSFNYNILHDLSVKLSYNRMRQYLFMLSNTIAISPTDRWKMTDSHITPPVSDQLSMGLYKNFNQAALETSAEVYVKKTRNIVEYKDGADLSLNPHFETLILQGDLNSWGAEFFIRRNAGRLTGWLSYTYSRSLVTVDGENEWDKINEGATYPSNFDKPHSVNFVGSYKFSRRVSIASNLVYSTGRPVTLPTGTFYVDGVQGVNYSSRNEYRIPDYFRIDLSFNFEGNLLKKKLAHGSWMFTVYNVLGRKNAYSVYFKNEKGNINGYKQSIYGVPVFTVSYNFKLGNYAVE